MWIIKSNVLFFMVHIFVYVSMKHSVSTVTTTTVTASVSITIKNHNKYQRYAAEKLIPTSTSIRIIIGYGT